MAAPVGAGAGAGADRAGQWPPAARRQGLAAEGARAAGQQGPARPEGLARQGAPGGAPPGGPDGPTTVPFHRVSDEADLEIRLEAVVHLLLEKRLISEDELEETVLKLMRRRDEEA